MLKRILVTCLLSLLVACGESTTEPIDRLEALAKQAAEEAAAQTVDPHEINMIEFRRKVMGAAGLQLYVIFINDMGQPVDYFVTKGKCTSSNKRLTPGYKVVEGDGGSYVKKFDVPAAAEDGAYGSSDEYIYCFTADGRYKQWNGEYYISDRPIELSIKPLVIDVRGVISGQ